MDMYQKRKMRAEKKNNNNQESFPKVSISWYPGHMAKTRRLIQEKFNLIEKFKNEDNSDNKEYMLNIFLYHQVSYSIDKNDVELTKKLSDCSESFKSLYIQLLYYL